MSLSIALVGTGNIAKVHARAVRSLPDVHLVAVVNHRPESMTTFAAEFGVARLYVNVADMLEDGAVDALVVCTPNFMHAPQTIAALRAGVHVMVEKPMAMNATEARSMLEASRESNTFLMVAHCWRFEPEVLWLREQVISGKLGDVIRTKGYGVHVDWGPSGWFAQQEYAGGGALLDMGIHALDTARFLLGDPQPASVYARIGTYYRDMSVDDTGILFVNWMNGATSYIESGWWQPQADGLEAATQLYGTAGFGRVFPTYLEVFKDQSTDLEKIDPGFPPERNPHCPQSMYTRQMTYFVDCVRNGQSPTPSGLEGWVNMKIVDAAYESANIGEVIEL
jgi:predicted dehydrogenase